jgi:fructosamine-3-kinase
MSLPAGATGAHCVGGGDINEAWRVALADGREAFVKTRSDAGPGEYAAEARGLRWLAEPGALRTPRVLEVAADRLVLEWVPPGGLSVEGAEELGRGLALTHAAGVPAFGDPGPGVAVSDGAPINLIKVNRPAHPDTPDAAPSTFGSLRLPNDPAPDWPTFYVERRLLPLARVAVTRGALSAAGTRAVEAVCARLPALAGPSEPPARLHGDLWSGNVLADAEGRP